MKPRVSHCTAPDAGSGPSHAPADAIRNRLVAIRARPTLRWRPRTASRSPRRNRGGGELSCFALFRVVFGRFATLLPGADFLPVRLFVFCRFATGSFSLLLHCRTFYTKRSGAVIAHKTATRNAFVQPEPGRSGNIIRRRRPARFFPAGVRNRPALYRSRRIRPPEPSPCPCSWRGRSAQ